MVFSSCKSGIGAMQLTNALAFMRWLLRIKKQAEMIPRFYFPGEKIFQVLFVLDRGARARGSNAFPEGTFPHVNHCANTPIDQDESNFTWLNTYFKKTSQNPENDLITGLYSDDDAGGISQQHQRRQFLFIIFRIFNSQWRWSEDQAVCDRQVR